MINKKRFGFATYEVLTVFVMLLIIMVVLLARVFKTDYQEKYDIMSNNARMFSLAVSNLYIEDVIQDSYYLEMIIDKKLFSNIKNPFKGEKYCNPYQSKVVIKNNKKYVTLECGNYLIFEQDSLEKSYTIYQVGNWSSKKVAGNVQKSVFYNYPNGNENVFSENLEEDIFLYEFNKLNKTDYKHVQEIPEKYQVFKETKYRYLKKVSE